MATNTDPRSTKPFVIDNHLQLSKVQPMTDSVARVLVLDAGGQVRSLGVDILPKAGSKKLLLSGAIFNTIYNIDGSVAIPIFNATSNGIVPASGGGSSNFLRSDGVWAVPPAWLLASGGVLTGVNTIVSNAKNQLIFNGTWAATAATDTMATFGGVITAASGLGVIGYTIKPSLAALGVSSVQVGLDVAPVFSGGTTPVNITARFQNGGVIIGNFSAFPIPSQPDLLFARLDQNSATRFGFINATSGSLARAAMLVSTTSNYSNVVYLQALSAGYSSSGMEQANTGSLVCIMPSGLNIGTTNGTQLSFWTNNTERARFLSTGELLVGYTVSAGSGELFGIRKDQNAATVSLLFNNTSGTAARIYQEFKTSTFSGYIHAASVGYTSGFLNRAGEFSIYAGAPVNFGSSTSSTAFWANNIEAARFLSTGEFLIGYSVVGASELVGVRRDSNGSIIQRLVNATSGNAARAYFSVGTTANATAEFGIMAHSAGYTTAGIMAANTAVGFSSMPNGLNIGTTSATQLSFWTNNTERARFLSTGELVLNQNTVDNSSFFEVWGTGTAPGIITAARAVNTLGNGNGFQTVFLNSTSVPVVYTYFNGIIEANTAGAHAGSLGFYTARASAGGAITEAARFLSTGEFLIGYTSKIASEIVGIRKDQNAGTYYSITNATSGTGSFVGVAFQTTAAVNPSFQLLAFSAGYTTSGITVANTAANFSSMAGGLNVGTNTAAQLSFWTNNAERARFLSTGEFLVGYTAGSGGGELFGVTKIFAGSTVSLLSNTSTSGRAFQQINGGTVTAFLVATGSAFGTSGMNIANEFSVYSSSNINFGSNVAGSVSFWTNTIKRQIIDSNGLFTFTQSAQSASNTFITFTQSAHTGGSPTGLLYTHGAHTGLTLSVESLAVNFNTSATVQYATGSLARSANILAQAPTVAFVGASTLTDNATFTITGAARSGANATTVNAHGLLILATASVNSATNTFGATINAQTGGTNNYAAQTIGGSFLFAAGTTTYPSAIIPSGTNLTTTQAGALENNGTHLYFTFANAGLRYQLDQQVQTIVLSGDVSGTGTTAITTAIGANVVTIPMMAQIATARILGRLTAATGNVEVLTGTQVTSMLDVFTSTLNGLVPLSAGGTTNFLRADGTWAPAAGGGSAAGVANEIQLSNGSGVFIAGGSTWAANTLTLGLSGNTALTQTITTNGSPAGTSSTGLTITTKTSATTGVDGGTLNIIAGSASVGTGRGGSVNITGGDTIGNPGGASGQVTISGGSGAAGSTYGGSDVKINGGFLNQAGMTGAGFVRLTGGISTISGKQGGQVKIIGGNTSSGNGLGADVTIIGGQGAGTGGGGNVVLNTALGGATGTTGAILIQGAAATTGTPSLFVINTSAHTTITATELKDISFNLNRNVQFIGSTGFALQRAGVVDRPTYSFVTATGTIVDAATWAISGAPAAGTNAALTNTHGLLIQSGAVGAQSVNSFGATINAQTGATNNYAGQTIGGNFLFSAATTTYASIRLPHGTAPTTPVNGDLWTTTVSAFGRFNGVTVDMITKPAGNVNQIQYNNTGVFGASTALTWDSTVNSVFVINVANTFLTQVGGGVIFLQNVGSTEGIKIINTGIDKNLGATNFTVSCSTGADCIVTSSGVNANTRITSTGSGVGGTTYIYGAAGASTGLQVAATGAILLTGGTTVGSIQIQPGTGGGTVIIGNSNFFSISSGGSVGFFGATVAVQQAVSTILVNNVTSGGALSTIADYTSLSVYSTDAATIRNNFFRLAEKVLKLENALRQYGLVIN